MNRAILMAGLVLSIAVLATGTVFQSAEAAKPSQAVDEGVKVKVSLGKGPADGEFKISAFSSNGISSIVVIGPSSANIPFDGKKNASITIPIENGDYTIVVFSSGSQNPNGNFEMIVENGQITDLAPAT